MNKAKFVSYFKKGIVVILLLSLMRLICSCSTLKSVQEAGKDVLGEVYAYFFDKPEDEITVEWHRRLSESSLIGIPSFKYNGVEYCLLDYESCWSNSYEDNMEYLGMIYVGGTNGSDVPITFIGIPIYGSYCRALGYFKENSDNPSVIICKGGIWVDENVVLSPADEQPFGKCSINVFGKGTPLQFDSESGFCYCDITQKDSMINEEELEVCTHVGYIELYLEQLPCLCCTVFIYEFDNHYYVPSSIGLSDNKKDEHYNRLNDEWEAIIDNCSLHKGGADHETHQGIAPDSNN